MRCFTPILIAILLPLAVHAQAPTVVRWGELPKVAANWPPPWAALVRDAAATPDFEPVVLEGVETLLKAEKRSAEAYQLAETVLSAALRQHLSVRRPAPRAVDPSAATTARLADSLANVRKDWLASLQKNGKNEDALRLADSWLPVSPRASPLRAQILALWIAQARTALAQKDYAAARRWLDRSQDHFDGAASLQEIAKPLQTRAETLLKEANDMPDAPAQRALEEALTLWPRLPGARDALAKRQGTYRALVVAVSALPEQLSPATASTEIERQALELIFERLYRRVERPVLGKRYEPQLAANLVSKDAIHLRKNAYWSSGERVTAADVRHTALLMKQMGSALWRDYLELPRGAGSPFHLHIDQRQGLLDRVAPLTFWILPQYYRGKQLQRGDDADFAKAPVGSGPFQDVGRKGEAGRVWSIFQANPHDLRSPVSGIREIRLFAWSDARKDFPKVPPHLVLDPPPVQRKILTEMGYTDVPTRNSSRVFLLAINHRKPILTSVALRRAMAHGMDRNALLNRYFRSEPGKDHATASSLLPRDSWAAAPPPRVPADLFNLEQARSFAKQIKKPAEPVTLTLKYPAGDGRVKAACDKMATALTDLLRAAGIAVEAQPLAPSALRKALMERDFDLLYTSHCDLDDPVRLALFFDRQEESTRKGGSNYLGYDNDVKLHELLRGATQHCQFATIQTNMQALDVHLYETMPAIPLWQLDPIVMVHPSLQASGLDPRAIFANVRGWTLTP